MTPKQFRNLLKTAGLSQSEAGRLIGVTDRQMRRYAAGDAEVPLTVQYALRYVIERRKKEFAK